MHCQGKPPVFNIFNLAKLYCGLTNRKKENNLGCVGEDNRKERSLDGESLRNGYTECRFNVFSPNSADKCNW